VYCDNPWTELLKHTLDHMGCEDAWQVPWQNVHSDFLLADGCQVVQGPVFGIPADGCIELMLPMSGHVDFTLKTLLGAEGAAHLVEKIVNASPGTLC